MRCPSFLWFFVQVKLGQNLPCPVVMARQGRQDKTCSPLLLSSYMWWWQGKARQKNLLCLATVVMCGDGKVEQTCFASWLSGFVCPTTLWFCVLSGSHTHTHGMPMHWSNGGGSFGSDGRNYNFAARLLLTRAPPLAAMVKGLLQRCC